MSSITPHFGSQFHVQVPEAAPQESPGFFSRSAPYDQEAAEKVKAIMDGVLGTFAKDHETGWMSSMSFMMPKDHYLGKDLAALQDTHSVEIFCDDKFDADIETRLAKLDVEGMTYNKVPDSSIADFEQRNERMEKHTSISKAVQAIKDALKSHGVTLEEMLPFLR